MITLELIRQFAAKPNDCRHYMRQPFKSHNHIIATNGHIAIAVNLDLLTEALYQKPEQTMDHYQTKAATQILNWLQNEQFSASTTLDHIQIPPKQSHKCEFCKGSGKIKICPRCDGMGIISTKKKGSRHCPKCKGAEFVAQGKDEADTEQTQDCQQCDDGIYTIRRASIQINDQFFDGNYIELIQQLPNVQFATGTPKPNKSDLPVAKFTFTGGEGLLMPRSR